MIPKNGIYEINSYKNKLGLSGANIHDIFFNNNVSKYLFDVNWPWSELAVVIYKIFHSYYGALTLFSYENTLLLDAKVHSHSCLVHLFFMYDLFLLYDLSFSISID